MPTHQTITIREARPTFRDRAAVAWDSLRHAVRSFTVGPLSLKDPELARKLNWHGPTAAGVHVTTDKAFGVAAFWSAVTLIAGDIASLPLITYQRDGRGGKSRAPAHYLYSLLHDAPNPEMSAMQWRETWLIWALTTGNGYCEIVRNGMGHVTEIWPLPPDQVQVVRNSAGALRYRVPAKGGGQIDLWPHDVLHLRGPSPDGIVGFDTVHQAREALGLSLAAEKFGSAFFSNGATFGGVVSSPKVLGALGQNNLRDSINAMHQGAGKAHGILVLEDGATYSDGGGVEPDSAQFLETRTFQLREIARYFKIPPSKIGELTNSNFSTVEQENLAYFTSCIRPWLVRIEQELTAKLLWGDRKGRATVQIEHVAEGLLRANTEARGAFYAQMLSHGVMTVNEVRQRENLSPLDNVFGAADIPRVPVNTTPLTAMSAATPQTEQNQ